MIQNWDYIVIGGGSAGAVVAGRLSEDPACQVLLLEGGGSHRHPYVDVPAFMMFSFPRPDMNWQYIAQPDATRGGMVDMWPAGKMLGGGSSLNGMMFVRGHGYDYDLWAQMGNPGWSHEDVLPYFKKLERSDTGANDQRGGEGPLAVEQPRSPHVLCQPFIDACGQVGIAKSEDLNGASREGAGLCQASQAGGVRASTGRAYLDPARSRRNLTVRTGVTVEKILIENSRAVGVLANGETLKAGGVVLSAGAMASPKLLMLSGIGDPVALQTHGIETIHALRGVGKNLQEHPGISLHFNATVPSLTSDQGIIKSPLHALNYALTKRGPLATPIGHAQAFVRTREGLAAPDVQIILSPSAYDIVDGKAKRKKTPEIHLAIGLCRPLSRGEIRLADADPASPPVIDHPLLDADEDVATLVEGLKIARKIIEAPALAQYVDDVIHPGPGVVSDADMAAFVRETAFLMYHASGSCRMGPGGGAVVDHRLKVRGLERLWVADASIIPSIPAGNINATCIMIGEKAADMIRKSAAEMEVAA